MWVVLIRLGLHKSDKSLFTFRVSFFASLTNLCNSETNFYNDLRLEEPRSSTRFLSALKMFSCIRDRIVQDTILFKVSLAKVYQDYAIFWQIGHSGHVI